MACEGCNAALSSGLARPSRAVAKSINTLRAKAATVLSRLCNHRVGRAFGNAAIDWSVDDAAANQST